MPIKLKEKIYKTALWPIMLNECSWKENVKIEKWKYTKRYDSKNEEIYLKTEASPYWWKDEG